MSDVHTVVLATRNAGKVREMADALAAFGLTVLGLESFPQVGEIEESGVAFEENALLKACAVAESTGHIAVADDSGLEVDALHGAPGVYSARYADDWEFLPGETRDQRNNRKLLHALRHVPASRRGARFVCAMAVRVPGGGQMAVRGVWEGRILDEPRGGNGFGFDPLFLDERTGRAAAELTRDEKNARSHRGAALAALLAAWPRFMAKQSHD